MHDTNRLLAFYIGGAPDDRGRTLAEILRQDDAWLESTHDFVQWLFPLDRPSGVNPSAPLLTGAVERAFLSDASLRDHLRAALQRMLAFYGLQDDGHRVVPAANWPRRKGNWFTRPTHNDLRITRILRCLCLLGLREDARRLLDGLERLRETEPDCAFSPTALRHWRQAVA